MGKRKEPELEALEELDPTEDMGGRGCNLHRMGRRMSLTKWEANGVPPRDRRGGRAEQHGFETAVMKQLLNTKHLRSPHQGWKSPSAGSNSGVRVSRRLLAFSCYWRASGPGSLTSWRQAGTLGASIQEWGHQMGSESPYSLRRRSSPRSDTQRITDLTSFVYSMQPRPATSPVGSAFSRSFSWGPGLGGWARCARNDSSTVRRAEPPAARSGTSGPRPEAALVGAGWPQAQPEACGSSTAPGELGELSAQAVGHVSERPSLRWLRQRVDCGAAMIGAKNCLILFDIATWIGSRACFKC
ncbi:uncharacterized protein LOC144158959 [Haemaphysalis longicornis]